MAARINHLIKRENTRHAKGRSKPNPKEDLPVVHQPMHVGTLPDRGGRLLDIPREGLLTPVELKAMDGQVSPHGVIIPEISH